MCIHVHLSLERYCRDFVTVLLTHKIHTVIDCGISAHSKPLLLLLYIYFIYLFFDWYRQSLDEQLEQHEKYQALVDKWVSLAANY